jgi:methyl-accepting chemotaxis protein
MRKRPITSACVCALLLATGCATSGSVEKLEERVGALEQRVSDAERKASAAQEAADRASADARNAADSMRRADAMFQKSVTK